MVSRRISSVLITLIAIISAVLGASTNVATGILPGTWQPHLWLAWPVSAVCVASLIRLSILQARYEQQPAAEGLRSDYLKFMASEWNTLRLQALDSKAVDADSRTQPLALEQVYVALDTHTSRPRQLYLSDKKDYEQPPLSAIEALCHEPSGRLVLLGQPGSGKSTLARYLSLMLAKALLEPGAFALSDRLPGWKGPAQLPLVVPLGRLVTGLQGDGARDVAAGICAHVESYGDLAGYGSALLEELQQKGGLVIFDGLDEVPGSQRTRVKTALSHFADRYERCRLLVTCRTHSYQHDSGWQLGWPVAELAPFDDKRIDAFITAWHKALSQRDPSGAVSYQQKAATLRAALTPNDPRGLHELAQTPLLLTVMAVVHGYKDLPGSRVAVYRECVDLLLQRWQKHKAKEGGRQSLLDALAPYGVTERQLEQGLWEVAYRAHEVGEADRLGGSGRALISGDTLRGVLHRHFEQPDVRRTHQAVEVFLDYCHHANGLVLAQGTVVAVADGVPEPVYAFPHLTFEEYLAARHLRRWKVEGSFTRKAAELAGEPAWREIVRFLGEYLCHDKDGGDTDQAEMLLARLCPEETPSADPDWRRILLAGELLQALRREVATPDRQLEERIQARLIALLQESKGMRDAPQERAAAGRALARLGDRRPGVDLRDGLPELAWVRIPGTVAVQASGQFLNFTGLRLGNGAKPDSDAREEENWPVDREPLEIVDFALAAYPVTVAQFRPFIVQGYREDRWWSEAGKRDRGDRTQPYLWDDPVWMLNNHPVVGVTWYEVQAYCHWLNEQLGLPPLTVRLPTEAEWEWAARGPEGWRYPWGDKWESWRCNSSESGINRTSAVGCFPGGAANWWRAIQSDSVVVHDLAGNVWEWTASGYSGDYSTTHLSVLNANPGGPCVLRGGSWLHVPLGLRGAARYGYDPRAWNYFGGFRLARTLTL